MITRNRFLHRHIAIGALYFLLIITVLGLIYVLSIFNSAELPFMVKSPSPPVQSSNYQQKSMINIDDDKRGLSNSQTTQPPFKSHETSDDDQQHIYIDDVYRSDKLVRSFNSEYFYTRASRFTATGGQGHYKPPKITSELGSGTSTQSSNNALNQFDRLRGTYVDNEEASGSGSEDTDINAHLDMETKKFMKRINLRLLKKGESNMTAGKGKEHDSDRPRLLKQRSHSGRMRYVRVRVYNNKKLVEWPTKKIDQGSTKPLEKANSLMEDDRKHERRIISNEKESADRSRKLLLCEQETESGVGMENELCRMLFKES
ncbi:glutamate receptor ionotropic kainate 2 [Drosophila madeirensis]|uniref:Glutamate receptor ionotropic kainate 2 n=1 Tax=Drosophila madeirensis TaxID=30013 RepID=A0AAU9GFZ1_DROMD